MSNLVDKAIELQVMTCLDSLLDRANHDEYLQRIGKKEALRFLEQNRQYVEIIKSRLQRLEAIENSNPNKALECLEDIYRNAVFISAYDVFGEQHSTNISPETNKSISVQCNTIKQALLKAQEQEKEKLLFKNIHNTKVKTPLVSIFEGISKDEHFKFTEHIYYHWEEMKEALEDKNNELEKENAELKAKAQKERKALGIIKEKKVSIFQLSCCKNVDEYNALKFKDCEKLTQEEFNLLKEMLE